MGRGFWCGANGPLSSPEGDLIDLDPSTPHVRVSEVLLITCTGVCARWFSVHPLSYFSKCSHGGSFLPPRGMSAACPKPGSFHLGTAAIGAACPLQWLRIAAR
ncbi:unnamed protein product [Rangifer tarandus platyrhynchus]|uniref:Uncharacterized protein n=1 Tax=Rangifer tarandus platyrhynchus TaxID=3082113 RepID=A0AC59YAX5_RANTA